MQVFTIFLYVVGALPAIFSLLNPDPDPGGLPLCGSTLMRKTASKFSRPTR